MLNPKQTVEKMLIFNLTPEDGLHSITALSSPEMEIIIFHGNISLE
jgi:hypothetical protein